MSTNEVGECERLVVWHDEAVTAIGDHAWAWPGSMPCTGPLKCIYCGKRQEEVEP